jgi:glycosyltransferase involved in cell wall biosynthesis
MTMTRTVLAPPPPRGLTPGPRPTFSVVIASYELPALLAEAVESALEQTYPPLEVIVSDDGSQADISRALARFGDRVTLSRGEHRGIAPTRNAGFRAARGDFVVLLDQDDLFLPERLEALAEAAVQRPDLDVLTTDAFIEYDGKGKGQRFYEALEFPTRDQRASIVADNFVYAHAAVRREALLRVDGMDESQEVMGVDDWDLWIRLIFAGSRIGLVPEPLMRYRIRSASYSMQREARLEAVIALLEKTARVRALRRRERRALAGTLRRTRGRLLLKQTRTSLIEGTPQARGLALRLLLSRGVPARRRLTALAWALAPSRARARLIAVRGP